MQYHVCNFERIYNVKAYSLSISINTKSWVLAISLFNSKNFLFYIKLFERFNERLKSHICAFSYLEFYSEFKLMKMLSINAGKYSQFFQSNISEKLNLRLSLIFIFMKEMTAEYFLFPNLSGRKNKLLFILLQKSAFFII